MEISPKVSGIVPCYNEESTIRLMLDALVRQTYPKEDLEVVVADGMSNDNTVLEIEDCRGRWDVQ
ncbi:MAG: glycosyltransferase [Anaerolineales bacterium]